MRPARSKSSAMSPCTTVAASSTRCWCEGRYTAVSSRALDRRSGKAWFIAHGRTAADGESAGLCAAGSSRATDTATIDPSPMNPLGIKGVGSCQPWPPAAVANAVLDALSGFGVRHIDTPLTSEKIWRAMCTAHVDL